MEFLDGITEGDNVVDVDTEDEDDTEDAGASPAMPSAWYGCLWFLCCGRSNFFSLVLILYALLSRMPALG